MHTQEKKKGKEKKKKGKKNKRKEKDQGREKRGLLFSPIKLFKIRIN